MPISLVRIKRKSSSGGGFTSPAFRTVNARQMCEWDILDLTEDQQNAPSTHDLEIVAKAFTDYGYAFPVTGMSLFEWRNEWTDTPETISDSLVWVYPWIRCIDVSLQRDPAQRMLWRARSEWASDPRFDTTPATFSGYLVSSLPNVGAYPKLEETIWSDTERIQNEEFGDNDPKLPLKLPTGNLFAQPFTTRFPRRTIRVTLFEKPPSTIEELVESRMFAVNATAYKGDPAPIRGDANAVARWMITNVTYQNVALPYSNGGVVAYDTGVYMTTYTVERNGAPGGWWDRRALIDYYYLKQSDDLTTLTAYREPSDAGTILPVLLLENGTKKGNQMDDPNYLDFEMQKKTNFSFLL